MRVKPKNKDVMKTLARTCLRQSLVFQEWYIHSREYFPYLLNAKKLLGVGVEIGVQHGYYSEVILNSWKGNKLYSVDPWREFSDPNYIDKANVPQVEHERHYQFTVDRLSRFKEKSHILRLTSAEAARKFGEGELDFVYLDAQHHYEAVKEDIFLWYSKVKAGGVLAGHDYLDGKMDAGMFGVKSAVDEVAKIKGMKLIVSKEKDWPSWFLFV